MIIREARPDEYPAIGELRVTAYQALGLLPEGSEYVNTLRGFGFGTDCAVLVATDETGSGILGTITIEPFEPSSELARDDTEADVRAFAVAPHGQGQGVGRSLLQAVIERSEKRGLRCLRLCTNPVMRAAQHLYETTGFSRTPELDWSPAPGLTLRAYELALPILPSCSFSFGMDNWTHGLWRLFLVAPTPFTSSCEKKNRCGGAAGGTPGSSTCR